MKRLVFPGDPPPLVISPEQMALLVELGAAREGTNFYVAQTDRATADEIINRPEVMRCDFCSTIPCVVTFVTGDYPTVKVGSVQHVSLVGFSACEDCAKLVRAREVEAVYLRSVKLLSAKAAVKEMIAAGVAVEFENAVRQTQQQFFDHWQGKEVAL